MNIRGLGCNVLKFQKVMIFYFINQRLDCIAKFKIVNRQCPVFWQVWIKMDPTMIPAH